MNHANESSTAESYKSIASGEETRPKKPLTVCSCHLELTFLMKFRERWNHHQDRAAKQHKI